MAHDLAHHDFPLLDHWCVVAVVAVAIRRSGLAHADLALLSILSLAGFLEVKIYISSALVTRACSLLALLAVLPTLTRLSPARSLAVNSRRSTSDTSAEFSDAPGTSRFSRASKAFGGRSTASRSQHQSVQVHIEEETHVDDSSVGGLAAGAAQLGARPYAVKFESARTDSEAWAGGEKGDVELGRVDSVHLSEKY